MSGFSFGTPTTTTSSVSFASPQANASSGFSFGSSTPAFGAAAPAKPSTGFSFGAPAAAPSTGGFNFGQTPAIATATVNPQPSLAGFGFGTPTAAVAPNMSLPTTSAPAFGASLTQPSFGGIQTTAPPAFGNTTTPSLSFGSTAAAAPPAFGSQPAPAGLSFGAQTTAPPAFGSTMTAPTFGSAAQSTSLTLPTTSAPAIPTLGLSFGQTPTVASTIAPASTAPPAFGFNTSTASTSIAPIASSASSLFSVPAATTTVQATVAPTTNIGGLFAQSTAPVPLFGATMSAPITTKASTFVGLGGIDMSATQQQKAPEGKIEATKVKETQVPIQIVQSVEEFKNYIKNQKTISSEITRSTDRKLKTVTDEVQRMNCVVQEVSNNIDTNRSVIKHLRNETSKVIENADMAQRTHETPSGLQFENFLPQIYFRDLIQRYETDLMGLKHQVELTEKHLQSLANPQNFSPQELKRGLQQIHECFIALAGRVQEAHTKVENQKEQYLALRKYMLRDSTNVFEVASDQDLAKSSTTRRVQYGPNAFSNQGGFNVMNIPKFTQQQATPQQQQQQQMPAFNTTAPTTSSFFGGATSFGFK